MPILRERVTKNFTTISNRVLRDRRLRGEEKGLLFWLLSHDRHWRIVIPVITREMGWGRDKTYRILKRLCELGYIQRAQERDPVSGAFGEVSYTVYSNPDSNLAYAGAIVQQPLPDSPLPEKSKASKERSIDSQETPPTPSLNSEQAIGGLNKNALQQTSKELAPTCEQFWQAYAPDAYMSRSKTERRWRRTSPADRQKAFSAVAAYLADCRTNNRKRMNIVGYLADRIWEGFSTAENTITLPTIEPKSPEWNAWRNHFVATQPHRVAFFDTLGREGKPYTVPSKLPPTAT
jgi:hypothetical protein